MSDPVCTTSACSESVSFGDCSALLAYVKILARKTVIRLPSRSALQKEMGGPWSETDAINQIDQALAVPVAAEPEQPAPEQNPEHIRAVISETTADRQIDQADWKKLSILDAPILSSSLEQSGMAVEDAEIVALIASGQEALCLSVQGAYVAQLDPDSMQIKNEPFTALLDAAFQDLDLTLEEARILRQARLIRQVDLQAAVAPYGFEPRTQAELALIIESSLSFSDKETLFPIHLAKGEAGNLGPQSDLAIATFQSLLLRKVWHSSEKHLARKLMDLEPEFKVKEANLQAAGLDVDSSRLIVKKFYEMMATPIVDLKLLDLEFVSKDGSWSLAEHSKFDLSLPWHPVQISEPYFEEGDLALEFTGQITDLASYEFPSGNVEPARSSSAKLGKHPLVIIVPTSLAAKERQLFGELEYALLLVPYAHSKLIAKVEIDTGLKPGSPDVSAAAYREEMKITFFKGRIDEGQTILHEIGHLVQYAEGGVFLESDWKTAVQQDGVGISLYGFDNLGDDFAETYSLYRAGGKEDSQARRRYANRCAILDRLEGK